MYCLHCSHAQEAEVMSCNKARPACKAEVLSVWPYVKKGLRSPKLGPTVVPDNKHTDLLVGTTTAAAGPFGEPDSRPEMRSEQFPSKPTEQRQR